MSDSPIPVTLLTGFLGSGKSTLLTQVLRDPRFNDSAVVVNEFGEVGLDGELIEHSTEQLVEMTSGCLCCTIRGDIRETLLTLHRRQDQGEIPSFRRLIVETTGLADPAPVIHTLMTDMWLQNRYMLGGIVTTVDIVNGSASLARHAECVKQVAVADRIVLTKTDLAVDPDSRADPEKLRDQLHQINPGTLILDRNDPSFDVQELFETSLYDPASKSYEVQRWLNLEAYEADNAAHAHHHHHDVNRHDAEIEAFCLVLDKPISTLEFMAGLELLIASRGPDLLRVKGIINLLEKPETPVVIHGVQHVFHNPVWLDKWPGEDRRTKIVFITRNIAQETIEAFFKPWRTGSGQVASTQVSVGST